MKESLTKIYTIICVLSPILVLYSFVGGSFTVLDNLIVLFYFVGYFCLVKVGGIKIMVPYMVLFLFLLFHGLVDYSGNSDFTILLRVLHLANYVLFIAFFNKSFFNLELAYNVARSTAIIATLFLILQHVVYRIIGFSVPGILPVFSIAAAWEENIVAGTEINRFSSFFVEPASYACYIICPLLYELFYTNKPNMKVVSLLVLGCIMSTSNTALASMALVLLLYFLRNGIFDRKFFLFILLAIFLMILVQPYIEANLSRIEDGGSMNGRFEGYGSVKELLINSFWGIGFVSTEEFYLYLAGFPRLFVYMGIIGVLVYGGVYSNLFFKSRMKVLVLTYLTFNLGGDSILGVFFLFYNCFIAESVLTNKRYKR